MKRLISLLMLLVIFFTLCACTKDEPIKPNSQTSTENSTSPSQTNDSNKENQTSGAPINTGVGYLDPNKKLNKSVMPTADVDKMSIIPVKTTDLKDKTLTFYTPERNSFTVGTMSETDWFSKVSDKLGVSLKYTVRPDNMLFSSQAIAQKSGLSLDLITSLVSNTAQSRTLMKTALVLNGSETSLPFSKRVYDMSGGKLFSAVGNSKMLWYNTDIVSDSKAYEYFINNEWTDLTLKFVTKDVKDAKKNTIECGNWAAFGSAAGVQTTGIAPDGTFIFSPESEASMTSFKTFADIFTTVSSKKSNFKNGGTAFCYTDAPTLDKGKLSFVPIPGIYQRGSCVAELAGTGMGISATASAEITPYALTFALLWVTRYSEARTDLLMHTYGLGAEKTAKYIECTESIGSLYNADRIVSSVFDMSMLSETLYTSPETMGETFKAAYSRAYVHNSRK